MSARWQGTSAVRQQPTFGAFVQGLMGAVALAGLSSTSGGSVDGAVSVAIGMGIAGAVFAAAGDWLSRVAGWFYSLLGIVAFVPAAVAFVRSNGCLPGPPPPLRFAAVLLLVAVSGAMYIARFVMRRQSFHSATGLAAFGALQILVAASTFIAGDSSVNLGALALMIAGASLLGWLVAAASDAVLGVAGVAFGMQSIYGAAVDRGCGGANYSGVVLIVVFCGAYFAARAVCAPLIRRR